MSVRLPTSRADVRLLARTVRLVLSVPIYAIASLVGTLLALSAFVLSQNVALVRDLIVGGSLPLAARLTILANLYPFVGVAYSALTGAVLLFVSAVVGVNLTMVAYHLREHRLSASGGGGSVAGVLLGTLGAGCAACGSAVLAGALSLVGGSGLLLLLPLDGLEFALVALVPLALSTYWLADGMRGGEVNDCPVDLR